MDYEIIKCVVCGKPIEKTSSTRKYCQDCKRDKLRAYYKKYYERNKTRLLKKNKEYRESNSERYKEIQRAYRAKNVDKERQRRKTYYATQQGKDSMSTNNHKRRAIESCARSDKWTASEIYKRDKGICQICGLPVYTKDDAPPRLKPHCDHIIPLNRGGTNMSDNIQLTHAFCNLHKHTSEADIEYCKRIIMEEIKKYTQNISNGGEV